MGDKGEGGVKNLKKWVTSFTDSPLQVSIFCIEMLKNKILFNICFFQDVLANNFSYKIFRENKDCFTHLNSIIYVGMIMYFIL